MLIWGCEECGRLTVIDLPEQSRDLYERISKAAEGLGMCVVTNIEAIKLLLDPQYRAPAEVAVGQLETAAMGGPRPSWLKAQALQPVAPGLVS